MGEPDGSELLNSLQSNHSTQALRSGVFIKSCSIITSYTGCGWIVKQASCHQFLSLQRNRKPLARQKNGSRCKTRWLTPAPWESSPKKQYFWFDTSPYTPWRKICCAKQKNGRERFKRPWDLLKKRLSWTDPIKATRKAWVCIRHKSLYVREIGPQCKTR